MFSVQVGQKDRIQATPINKASGQPEPTSGTATWATSDSAIATVAVNAGAAGGLQADILGIAPGPVTVTFTGQDTQNPPHSFTASFTEMVNAPVLPQADSATFTDLGPV